VAVVARIVVFGATGYTGELTARALVDRGAKPLLAGRSAARLEKLAAELGGPPTALADVSRPASVAALVEPGDVLVTTVGPFARWGEPAVEAAIAAPAGAYLDSTGEAAFIRAIFERHGSRAAAAGLPLLTAMGYDWVPGNLAGALALKEAGGRAVRLDLGYYFSGPSKGAMSGGTRATAAGATFSAAHGFRDGRIVSERMARRVRAFEVRGRGRPAVSTGSSEHFSLPRLYPELSEVNTYLGWFGPLSRPLQGLSAGTALLRALPGATRVVQGGLRRVVKGSTGGPDAAARARGGSHVVAIAYGRADEQLAEVRLGGANGYDFTAAMLAWAATSALAGEITGVGALGPVEAFGLEALERGCAAAGIARV